MYISVYTIEKTLYEGQADSLTLPGSDGELGVLATHIPLIALLRGGSIGIRRGRDVAHVTIRGGFVEVQPGSRIVVLAN